DLGPAGILVTSAGLIPNTESIMEMDMAAHDRMWQVNYNGTVHCARAFARQMIPQGKGAIVTLGSINSRLPLPIPAYNMGKAAIERLTQLLAVELGRHRRSPSGGRRLPGGGELPHLRRRGAMDGSVRAECADGCGSPLAHRRGRGRQHRLLHRRLPRARGPRCHVALAAGTGGGDRAVRAARLRS